MSAFVAAVHSGDLQALTAMLAKDARVVTDGGGKVRAALKAVEGADHVAEFLVDAARKRPDSWWRPDFTVRFATVNELPGAQPGHAAAPGTRAVTADARVKKIAARMRDNFTNRY